MSPYSRSWFMALIAFLGAAASVQIRRKKSICSDQKTCEQPRYHLSIGDAQLMKIPGLLEAVRSLDPVNPSVRLMLPPMFLSNM